MEYFLRFSVVAMISFAMPGSYVNVIAGLVVSVVCLGLIVVAVAFSVHPSLEEINAPLKVRNKTQVQVWVMCFFGR